MEFQLKPQAAGVSVPETVLAHLTDAPEDALRVALYLLKTQQADKAAVSSALGLPEKEVALHFHYWQALGLLEKKNGNTKTADKKTAGIDADNSAAPDTASLASDLILSSSRREVGDEKKAEPAPEKKRHRRPISGVKNDPHIATLLQMTQEILGTVISRGDTDLLLALYEDNQLPVDFILVGITHFAAEGHRRISYIARRLAIWQKEGIETVEAAEAEIRKLEARKEKEKYVASLLDLDAAGFSYNDRQHIANFYEGFDFNDDMVEAGALRCGQNPTVKYLNGILRKWYAAGYRTPADIPETGSNLQPVASKDSSYSDYVQKKKYTVPKFGRKGGI